MTFVSLLSEMFLLLSILFSPSKPQPVGGEFGECVRARETTGVNYQAMNSSGHYGAYQFSYNAWVYYGGNGKDFGKASPREQDQVFLNAIAKHGQWNWTTWDGCK